MAGGIAMHEHPIRGLLMGAALGTALWLIAVLTVFYSLGYLPRTLPYLWWLLGILMIFAALQLMLSSLRERPTTTWRVPRRS
jgi:O-antigen/teichoic acid export membrane protein